MGLFASLTDKSWETHGPLEELPSGEIQLASAWRTGLFTFLGVASALFALFISAYFVRSDYADWVPVEDPNLLWANTAILILASLALQFARNAATSGDRQRMRLGLLLGGLLTLAFLGGQYWAWQQLSATGAYAASDAAYAFFFLLTGIHGLHLAGGLYVWLKVMVRLGQRNEQGDVTQANQLRLSIELCSVYWHFLLVIWLVLFALLLNT
jgi:cytochrome c oxidase subunit 3